jgi:hypothetical protein
MVSLFGQIVTELSGTSTGTGTGTVFLPQAALTRSARLLETTAEMIGQGNFVSSELAPGAMSELALMFAEDAETLRALVSDHGIGAGPSIIS